MNKSKNVPKNVIELSNKFSELQLEIEKAHALVDEITNDYFREYDPDKEEDGLKIVYEYKRKRPFADMLSDYVYSVLVKIDEARVISEKLEKEIDSLQLF